MENYDIDTLIDTSYKTLYKYSSQLGLMISICKKNSFHPYIYHLNPYYTKIELIKLGQNMDLPEFKNKRERASYFWSVSRIAHFVLRFALADNFIVQLSRLSILKKALHYNNTPPTRMVEPFISLRFDIVKS
jgi:hypothetical protein